jgi:magnesium transporter
MSISYYANKNAKSPLIEVDSVDAKGIIVCVSPNDEQLEALTKKHKLDLDMLKDALDLYETPRTESYSGALYIYTRYCRPYNNELATEPIGIIQKGGVLIIILRDDQKFADQIVRIKGLIAHMGTHSILSILTLLNDSYRTYLIKISKQILSVRTKLKKHDVSNEDYLTFVDYEEDLNEIIGALESYDQILKAIERGKLVKMFEADRDILEDLILGVGELTTLAKTRRLTISNTREAYNSIVANNLNRTFKRLTSISIFLMIPTIVSGFMGMNVIVPLASNTYAFGIFVIGTVACVAIAVGIFKKLKWL